MIPNLHVFKAASLTVEECAEELRTDLQAGLSTADASRRIQFSGYNEFQHEKKESIIGKYFEHFKNPLMLLLLASSALSLLMKQYDDALSIAVAVIIVVTVEFVQEYKSEKTLQQLNKLVPPAAHCIRDGRSVQFLARELVPGDIVTLQMGDRIPADLRLLEAVDLHVDESSFTGENEPRSKHADPLNNPSAVGIEHLDNIVFMGTLISSGRGMGIVVATGANTKFGELFDAMISEEAPKTPLQNSMDHLGTQLTVYSFCVISIIFFIGLIQGRPALDMFTIGVSLAVAAIPEGLPVVVAVTLAIGVMRMGKRHAIVKKLSAVETLGCVTVICADKTGTLTKNEMTACVIVAADGSRADVTGVGYDPADGDCRMESGEKVSGHSHPSITRVIEIGCVCNNSQVINGTLLGQPTEGSLMVLAAKTQLDITRKYFRRHHEIPFKSETQWMAVTVEHVTMPGAYETMVKGAPDRVLEMCYGYYSEGLRPIPFTDSQKEIIYGIARGMGNSGLRVIAVASGRDMNSLYYAGLIGILDPPRSGCKESVEIVKSAGVSVKMITGDSMETACSVGARLQIYNANDSCLSGTQIDEMSDHELELIIRSVVVFYRASPKHKLKIVKALKNVGEVVAMTGDGVNDAIALKTSDIGIAMGISGTDVCKEASDMVLVDDNFLTIRAAIEEGKGVYYNITKFVRFQLSTSVAAMSLIALSTFFHFENPLNAMQILWINMIMDGLPAQSLGVEPVDPDIIKQKPRNVQQPMITRSLLLGVLSSAAIIIIGTMFVFYKEMGADNVITPRDTTMTFTCFVLFSMWNALSCRSSRKMIWEIGFFQNRLFCLAVVGSVIGQLAVIYLPPLQHIFQTEALSLYDLMFLTILSSSVFIFKEVLKFINLRSIKSKFSYDYEPIKNTSY